jgi:hypothetical protein
VKRRCQPAFVVGALLIVSALVSARGDDLSWQLIQPGTQFASIAVKGPSDPSNRLYVVRIDPAHAKLTVALASETKTTARTAAEWCSTSHLAVAINLGMFQNDGQSNVGYLRHGSHANNPRWNGYNSVLALNASGGSNPRALWLDRDLTKDAQQLAGYEIVVQNLRLIAQDRRNVWAKSDKRWSEAAVAIDSAGRVLFLFIRAPYTMREFNDLLLKLPLPIVAAMHVEGGPEASLSIHAPGIDLDLAGSYETGFWPNDSNHKQWPLPNVLGVVREK